MGLFDKKYCDICGEKIGLLGNRKLEDGNLCKNCAQKLSPLFSERRHSTVEEIKAQLKYREENAVLLENFRPDRHYGRSKMIFVDTEAKKFIVTSYRDWKGKNPDLISFDQVKNVQTKIDESRSEIYFKDSEGNEKSYSPPRYEYEYSFIVNIFVNSPWFDEISVDLTGSQCPDSPHSPDYRDLEFQLKEISDLLLNRNVTSTAQPVTQTPAAAPAAKADENSWTCGACGTANTSKFCVSCGSPKPENGPLFCGNCGWKNPDTANSPKFCPECGSKLG